MNCSLISFLLSINIILFNLNSSAMLENENSPYGIAANTIKDIEFKNVKIPIAKGDKIATLNKTGFMKTELDKFSIKFINAAKNQDLPVLEIGAAYGAATLPLLDKNVKVIANDIDEKHLVAILSQIKPQHFENLYLKLGSFPNQIDFPKESLSAILLCRVAHFFKGEEIELGLKKILSWLAPGGKLYFVSMSPYHHLLRDGFLPIYLKRQKNGDQWPGIINNMKDYNSIESEDIPNFLHVFDEEVMTNLLSKLGYKIDEIEKFDYSNNSSDNQGYLGFIASKPF